MASLDAGADLLPGDLPFGADGLVEFVARDGLVSAAALQDVDPIH